MTQTILIYGLNKSILIYEILYDDFKGMLIRVWKYISGAIFLIMKFVSIIQRLNDT